MESTYGAHFPTGDQAEVFFLQVLNIQIMSGSLLVGQPFLPNSSQRMLKGNFSEVLLSWDFAIGEVHAM